MWREPVTEQPEQPPDSWLEKIKEVVREEASALLGGLFDSGKATVTDAQERPRGNPARPAGPDVERQTMDAQDLVEKVTERIKAATVEDKEREAHDEAHRQVQALLERTPEPERKIERRMGWRM